MSEYIEVTSHTPGIYSVTTRRECGHVYTSECHWNSESAARRHGRNLVNCACGVCRDQLEALEARCV